MSDLSQQLHDQLHAIAGVEPGEGYTDMMRNVNTRSVDSPEGMEGAQLYYEQEMLNKLRVLYREYGGKSWPTNQDALDGTEQDCVRVLSAQALLAFTDGISIAQNNLKVVKKYRFLKKIDEIFGSESFHTENELYCMTLSEDKDLLAEVSRFVTATASTLAGLTSFVGVKERLGEDPDENPFKTDKVWDLWYLCSTSVSSCMYLAGTYLGKKWQEDDTLTGILTATTPEEKRD